MVPRADADARRARGLLLAFVLLVSQASAWFHAVAISHVACPEHGEAMHGRVLPDEATRAPAAGAAANDVTAVAADVATVAGHDHCANAALLRWRDVALSAPAVFAPFLPAAPPTWYAPADDLVRSAAVYLVAPKTSPPSSSA
jgi:hypothetical protein